MIDFVLAVIIDVIPTFLEIAFKILKGKDFNQNEKSGIKKVINGRMSIVLPYLEQDYDEDDSIIDSRFEPKYRFWQVIDAIGNKYTPNKILSKKINPYSWQPFSLIK